MSRWRITPESARAEIDRIKALGLHAPVQTVKQITEVYEGKTACKHCGCTLRYKTNDNLSCGGQSKCRVKGS